MRIGACDPASADAQALVDALSEALAAITGDSGRSSFAAQDDGLLFVLARAVDFYLRHGYRVTPNYGRYVGREEAVCFGKTLQESLG